MTRVKHIHLLSCALTPFFANASMVLTITLVTCLFNAGFFLAHMIAELFHLVSFDHARLRIIPPESRSLSSMFPSVSSMVLACSSPFHQSLPWACSRFFVHVHPVTFYALLVVVSEPLLTPWQLPKHLKLLVLFCLRSADAVHLLSVSAVWIRSPRPHQLPVSFLVFLTNDTRSSVSPHRHCLLHWLCTLTPCASANCTHAPFGRYSGSIFPSQAMIHGLFDSVTLLITAAIIATFRGIQPTECKN